jgi:hypothetical protein
MREIYNYKLVYQETDFEYRLVNSHQNKGRRKFENCESSVKLSCIGMLPGKCYNQPNPSHPFT